jgi:hypothetical protein
LRKDPRLVELILSETSEIVRQAPDVLIVEDRRGFAHAMLLPLDADASAVALKTRLDRMGAGFAHRPGLVGCCAVGMSQHDLATTTAGTVLAKEVGGFRRQNDVARFAALGFADRNGRGIWIEILHLEPRELAVAAAGFRRRLY